MASMEDLAKQRRASVHAAVLKLLDHGANTVAELAVIAAPMNAQDLADAAEERALAGKCGNPLCRQPVVWKEPAKRFNFDAREVEMLPSNHYCTARCEGVVARLGSQLGDPMSRLKPEIRQRLQQASHGALRPGQEHVAAQGGGVETMLSVVQERIPKAPIPLSQPRDALADPQTLALAQQRASLVSNSLSVEGFVPRSAGSILRQPPASTSKHAASNTATDTATAAASDAATDAAPLSSYFTKNVANGNVAAAPLSSYFTKSGATSRPTTSAAPLFPALRPKVAAFPSATSDVSEGGRKTTYNRSRSLSDAPAELRSSLKHSHSLNIRADVEWLDAAGCPIASEENEEKEGSLLRERRVTFWSADMMKLQAHAVKLAAKPTPAPSSSTPGKKALLQPQQPAKHISPRQKAKGKQPKQTLAQLQKKLASLPTAVSTVEVVETSHHVPAPLSDTLQPAATISQPAPTTSTALPLTIASSTAAANQQRTSETDSVTAAAPPLPAGSDLELTHPTHIPSNQTLDANVVQDEHEAALRKPSFMPALPSASTPLNLARASGCASSADPRTDAPQLLVALPTAHPTGSWKAGVLQEAEEHSVDSCRACPVAQAVADVTLSLTCSGGTATPSSSGGSSSGGSSSSGSVAPVTVSVVTPPPTPASICLTSSDSITLSTSESSVTASDSSRPTSSSGESCPESSLPSPDNTAADTKIIKACTPVSPPLNDIAATAQTATPGIAGTCTASGKSSSATHPPPLSSPHPVQQGSSPVSPAPHLPVPGMGAVGSLRKFWPAVPVRRKTMLIITPGLSPAHVAPPSALPPSPPAQSPSPASTSNTSETDAQSHPASAAAASKSSLVTPSSSSTVHHSIDQPDTRVLSPHASEYGVGRHHVVRIGAPAKPAVQHLHDDDPAGGKLNREQRRLYGGRDTYDDGYDSDQSDGSEGQLQADPDQGVYDSEDEGGIHSNSMSDAQRRLEEEDDDDAGEEGEVPWQENHRVGEGKGSQAGRPQAYAHATKAGGGSGSKSAAAATHRESSSGDDSGTDEELAGANARLPASHVQSNSQAAPPRESLWKRQQQQSQQAPQQQQQQQQQHSAPGHTTVTVTATTPAEPQTSRSSEGVSSSNQSLADSTDSHSSSPEHRRLLRDDLDTDSEFETSSFASGFDDEDDDEDEEEENDGDGGGADDVKAASDSTTKIKLVSHFFDRCPRAFRAEVAFLTHFNILQLALSQWVTPYTTAFVAGGNSNKGNGGSSMDQTPQSPKQPDMQQPQNTPTSTTTSGGADGSSGSSSSVNTQSPPSISGDSNSETTCVANSSDSKSKSDIQVSSSSTGGQDASPGKAALGPGTRYEDEEDGGALAALMAKPLAFHSAEHQSSVALAQMLGVALQPMLRPLCVPVSSLGEMHRKLQALLATFSFTQAVPALQLPQLQALVLVLLSALAPQHLPNLMPHFSDDSNAPSATRLQPYLDAVQLDRHLFGELVAWMSRTDVTL